MPVITRSGRPNEELLKATRGTNVMYASGPTTTSSSITTTMIKPTLHQSRTRFLPIEFDRNGRAYPKPDPQRPAYVQDYYKLRTDCLRTGTLFEDAEFPADDSSLHYSSISGRPSQYKWLRPHEISPDAVFDADGFSRFDIQQGLLGDCWLLAAAANLTTFPVLFSRVVPDDNDRIQGGRKGVDYAGIFHFRFWRFGQWYDVVVDDRLPTLRGQLVYIKSSTKHEFWSALLEKAYAKLFGSYEALSGGSASEAMEDFTGGLTEGYEMKDAPDTLFEMIEKGCNNYAMFACSIEAGAGEMEQVTSQGLVKGHAYSITKAQAVDIETPRVKGKIQLVRLRNPWGNENEWNGAWSDKSPEWRFITEDTKRSIGLTFEVDGEFWMSFPDFRKYFDRIEMCHLSPDCPIALQESRFAWRQSAFEGEWVLGSTAGGCRNFLDTFVHNPQYVIRLDDPDADDDEKLCTMIVSLIQKNRRSKRNKGITCLTIGFAIYRVEPNDLQRKPLSREFFTGHLSVAKSTFINLREVTCRFRLPPASYVIIPSTFDPNEEGEFMIRVFSECPSNMQENDSAIGIGTPPGSPTKPSVGVGSPTKPSSKETDLGVTDAQRATMERLFIEVAGTDGEVDWMELKLVLDRCFREDIAKASRGISQTYQTRATPIEKRSVPTTATAPGTGLERSICGVWTMLQQLFRDVAGGDNNPVRQANGTAASAGEQTELIQSENVSQVHADPTNPGFSKDACRSMVAMLDEDGSGKLGLMEFQKLLADIARWKGVFKQYDNDQSGRISPFELRAALQSAGYTLNNHIINMLMHRYGSKEGEIWFDDFITCAVKIRTMFDIFKARDLSNRNEARFTLEEWITKTIYS
ncbi:calpain-A-like isoform X1 [Anopheles funestus]|uniref:calpain-A-like isoform X1 n=1 Tax=Anopheles funestus TaxID=62324 RepID=UPI0020C5FB92|nr:calpain-A-like isoform X1 [Anopheles funestus]